MRVILASNNKGKIVEMKEILAPLGYEVVSQKEAGITLEPDENGTTFEANAIIKAEAIYNICKTPVISDDSGLEVDAMDKRPGVYSARYGGGHDISYNVKCRTLLNEIKDVPEDKRTARFVCVISFIDENGKHNLFRGECEGRIGHKPAGDNGFGFDPVFYVGDRSFAQISADEKNSISHRAKALKKLALYLRNEDN